MENFSFFKIVINIEFFKNYSLPRIGKFIDSRSNFERSKPASINPFSKFSKTKLNRIDIFFFFSRRIWKIVDALVTDSRNRNEFQRKIQRIGGASRRRQPTKIIARSMVSPAFLSRWKFTRPHIPRGSKSTPFPNRASSRYHAFSKLLLSPPPRFADFREWIIHRIDTSSSRFLRLS